MRRAPHGIENAVAERSSDAVHHWERWISEIIADFWSVARVGITSTLGLIGGVSLPRPFVFRLQLDDPHPLPWIRVKLSCALGHALYPHAQWNALSRRWDSFYPTDGLGEDTRRLLGRLVASIPEFLRVLLNHQPAALRGRSLMEVMAVQDRQPAQLGAHYQRWRSHPPQMYRAQPSLVFAALGQARADGRLSPEQESTILAQLLTQWALHSALDTSALCATLPTMRPSAPVT